MTSDSPPAPAATSPAARRARRHADLIADAARAGLARAHRGVLDHGATWQQRMRQRDHRVRLHALAVIRWASWHGWDDARSTAVLGVSVRALRVWRHTVGRPATPLGAPAGSSTPAQRRAFFDFLTQWGTDIGVPTLHDHFPELARGECARLLWLARCRVYRDQRLDSFHALRWTTPGTVWAIDATQPSLPIDGLYPWLLVLRDLASGFTIDALPVAHVDAATVIAFLARQFTAHGAPLVLKADNGGGFTAAETRALLDRWGVALLLSPPYTPAYNGACEAGIGALTTRIHHLAARHGDPTRWTSNQVDAARLLANRVDAARLGCTPEDRWRGQRPLPEWQRQRFQSAIAAAEQRRQADARTQEPPPSPGAIRRRATADALLGSGFLEIRMRPVRQPLPRFFSA